MTIYAYRGHSPEAGGRTIENRSILGTIGADSHTLVLHTLDGTMSTHDPCTPKQNDAMLVSKTRDLRFEENTGKPLRALACLLVL